LPYLAFQLANRIEGETKPSNNLILLISVAKTFMPFYYYYNMKSLIVYILLCADDSYYVGITNNLKIRLWQHETACNPESYTAQRLPVKLVYQELVQGPLTAIKREKQLKTWSREKKEALINGNLNLLKQKAKKWF
jgi:putative endonuclease